MRSSSSREELTAAFEEMRGLADRQPESSELQVLVAEIAYRLRRWSEVVAYIGRGGSAPLRPDQQFYLAVALYETGDRAAAARALDLCLPYLDETGVVRRYVEKIRGGQE
jgi:predicted Zn-dependent protease